MSNYNPILYEQQAAKKNRAEVHVAAQVEVVKFDAAKMTVDVKPLSKILVRGKFQSQSQILGVPCQVPYGAGFLFRPWYEKGDKGLVVYLDHDIDKTIKDGKEAEPNTERNHALTDASFIGGFVVWNEDLKDLPQGDHAWEDKSIGFGRADGSIFVIVTEDIIKSKGDVEHKGKVKSEGDVEITGDIAIKGDIDVTGKITATGEIHSDNDVTAGNVSLKKHTHMFTDVTPGGPVQSTTQTPQ